MANTNAKSSARIVHNTPNSGAKVKVQETQAIRDDTGLDAASIEAANTNPCWIKARRIVLKGDGARSYCFTVGAYRNKDDRFPFEELMAIPLAEATEKMVKGKLVKQDRKPIPGAAEELVIFNSEEEATDAAIEAELGGAPQYDEAALEALIDARHARQAEREKAARRKRNAARLVAKDNVPVG